jgi:ribosomal protein L11 methylase PrmA
MSTAAPDPGSFRDPSSRVYLSDDAVWRGLDADALADYRTVAETPFFTAALQAGQVVGTELVDERPDGLDDSWAGVLRHERIPVVTYPYEWSFEMLRDAARLQLDLVSQALGADLTTKDASAYNVQFVGSQPRFIDIGSFERLRDGEPWYGYRQFHMHFLLPLMLQAYRGIAFQPLLRADVEGVDPVDARRMMSFWDIVSPRKKGTLVHVSLQARAESATSQRDVKSELKRAGMKKELLVAQIRNLRKLVDKVRLRKMDTEWGNYSERGHYTDADLKAKEAFVSAVAAEVKPKLAWDLGANDGHFSRLVADQGAYVIAADGDHVAVDGLYRSLREAGDTRILPLVLNLADPSPNRGWRSKERLAFTERSRPQLVLALALIHHLVISRNVPMQEFVDFLADAGGDLVVEFPTPEDPMVQGLLRNKREGVHDDYTVDDFESALARRFDIRRRDELPSGTRICYHATMT